MARTLIVAALVLGCLALVTAQSGGPCIECNSCKGSNVCLASCQRQCPKEPTINVAVCKGYGTQAGKDAAKFACDLARSYCGNLIEPRRVPPPRVTLQQCGNAAYGVCQSTAWDRKQSPCGNMFNGAAKCSKDQFAKFYGGLVDEQCNQKVAIFDKPQGKRLF